MHRRASREVLGPRETLSADRARENLERVYLQTLPGLTEDQSVASACLSIHETAMNGWTLTGSNGSFAHRKQANGQDRNSVAPGTYRTAANTKRLGHQSALTGLFRANEADSFNAYIPSPREEAIDELMAKISARTAELRAQMSGTLSAVTLAAWTSSMVLLTRPFYDGNARTCRALFTSEAHRNGGPVIGLEAQPGTVQTGDPSFVTTVAISTLLGLYQRNPGSLTRDNSGDAALEARDLFAEPAARHGSVEDEQRRCSIEAVLSQHLDTVTAQEVRDVMGGWSMAYFGQAHLRPGFKGPTDGLHPDGRGNSLTLR